MHRALAAIHALFFAATLALALPVTARGAEHAHVHGAVNLNVAVEGNRVTLLLEAPLDSLVGFEHAPRTAEQKQAVQRMFERFNTPQSLFGFAPAAQCTLTSASAESDALRTGAGEAAKGGEEHADLDGSFVFDCRQLKAIDSIDLSGLLAAFARINRIDAVVVTPGVQAKRVVKRPEAILRWGR
jgi:hypothetical protein